MLKFYFKKGSVKVYEEPAESNEFNTVVYPFVRKICSKYAKNLDKEEIESEVVCELVGAYNDYLKRTQFYTFEEYAEERIIKAINEFRKNRNDIISVQSNFSLNQSFDNDSQAESFFYNEANNFENPIVFKLFLQNLEEEYFFICQDYIDGLSDTDIIAKYNFEKDDFIEKKKYIRKKLIEYIDIY